MHGTISFCFTISSPEPTLQQTLSGRIHCPWSVDLRSLEEAPIHWQNIAPPAPIHNERDYNAAVKRHNEFLDKTGETEKHPLYGLPGRLVTLIEIYESKHCPIFISSSAQM